MNRSRLSAGVEPHIAGVEEQNVTARGRWSASQARRRARDAQARLWGSLAPVEMRKRPSPAPLLRLRAQRRRVQEASNAPTTRGDGGDGRGVVRVRPQVVAAVIGPSVAQPPRLGTLRQPGPAARWMARPRRRRPAGAVAGVYDASTTRRVMSPRTTRIRSCLAQRKHAPDRATVRRRSGATRRSQAVTMGSAPLAHRSAHAHFARALLTQICADHDQPHDEDAAYRAAQRRHGRRTGSCAVQLHAWAHATRAHPRQATHRAARVGRAPTGPGPARGALGTHRRTNDVSPRDGRDSVGRGTRSVHSASSRRGAAVVRFAMERHSLSTSGAEESRALATATTRRAASPTGPRPARRSGCSRTRTPRPIRRFGEQATLATGHPHPFSSSLRRGVTAPCAEPPRAVAVQSPAAAGATGDALRQGSHPRPLVFSRRL